MRLRGHAPFGVLQAQASGSARGRREVLSPAAEPVLCDRHLPEAHDAAVAEVSRAQGLCRRHRAADLGHGGRRGTRAVGRTVSEYGVDRRTVVRWREWWRATFTKTRFWRARRSAFAPPVDEDRLPGSMLEKFLASPLRQLVKLLQFLTPITGGASAVRVS